MLSWVDVLTASDKPTFELHGVKLFGSFSLCFAKGSWQKQDEQFWETEISNDDLRLLTEASKKGYRVTLKFGSGEGSVKIKSFRYDPIRSVLTRITYELIDWVPK